MKNQNGQTLPESDLAPNEFDTQKITRMYKFPANTKQAEIHKRANKFGYNAPTMKNGSQSPICPCCQNPVNTVPIPLCYGTSPDPIKEGQVKFLLNAGTSIYLMMRFIICDGYNLWTSYQGHFCKLNPKQCSGDYNSYLSGYNKHSAQDEPFVDIVAYLNIAVTIASIIFFYYCRKHQYRVFNTLQHSNISQDQFSIFVQNISIFIYEDQTTTDDVKFQYQLFIKNKINQQITKFIQKVKNYKSEDKIIDYVQKDFKKFILQKNKNFDNQPIVTSVALCYDLSQMQTITQLRTKLMKEYENDEMVDISNPQQNNNLLKHIPNQIAILNNKYIELSKHFALDNSPKFNVSHFLGKAFITFQYQHYREYFLRKIEDNPDFFMINQKAIHIEKPVKPKDVFWTNLRISNEERSSTLIQSFVVITILLLFSLGVLVGVQEIQIGFGRKSGEGKAPDLPSAALITSINVSNLNESVSNLSKYMDGDFLKKQFINYLFVVLLPAITNLVNFSVTLAIQKLTLLQRHKTQTQKITSFIIKNVLSRFINTAILYYILSVLNSNIGPLTAEGFVMKVMALIGVSALSQIVTELIRPQVVLQFLTNKQVPSVSVTDENKKLFQVELNKLTQDPQFAFAEQYTFYLVQLFLASFYAVMVPAGVGILIFIFITQYWVDKYNLFRRFSCPMDFDFFLTRLAFNAFQCSLFIFAVGTFIFDQKIRVYDEPKFKYINLISIGISGAYLFLIIFGKQTWQKKIFAQDEQLFHLPYDYYLKNKSIKRTYWTENPATAFLKQKNINNEGFVEQPPQQKFVKVEDYNFYLHLSEKHINYEVYTKEEEGYFQNYYNDNYDYEQPEEEEKKEEDYPHLNQLMGFVKQRYVGNDLQHINQIFQTFRSRIANPNPNQQ